MGICFSQWILLLEARNNVALDCGIKDWDSICVSLLVFLMLNGIWILQAHRITAVALHLGVFQGIVISSWKHSGKEYHGIE